ncbi:hypothetical protein [Mucilaginibacter sp.]|uniref:S24 family peptidase n=1 Tax=Mucilaginibacter sp. TaxID=1882438 RepID=UPI0026095E23|nr:hypothetical protein [Mucilaginibacter sp.]MDB4918778.1 hypothetical protein [Mucilaginibacter sp.]
MSSVERLLLFIDSQGLSKRKFYDSVGVSNGYLDKVKSVGADILEKITYIYPDLNIMWVITGEGEMFKKHEHSPHANYMVSEPKVPYITNTPTGKVGVRAVKPLKLDPPTDPPTRHFTPQIITVDNGGNENIVYVPVKAAAGYLNGYADAEYVEKLPAFSLPGLKDATYRAFEIDGDSMFPTLENKEMIIGRWVEKLEDIREDRVHIIVTKNRGIIAKRLLNRIDKYGYIVAKSDAIDNRNLYPDIELYPDDILEIWYGVWHGSFNFKHPTDMYKRVNNMEADLTEVLRVLKKNNLLP